MKSKLIIYSLAFLSMFALTGCSNNNQTQALNSLESQIKRVESSVSSTEDESISTVTPTTTYSTNNSIQNHRANTYNSLSRENTIKHDLLSLNATVKSCLDENLKLSKTKSNALKTLSANISRNISKFNQTKKSVKSSVNNIKKSLKVPNVDVVSAETQYISLNNNMNERYVYLCNIYDNLEEAYFLICDCCTSQQSTQSIPDSLDSNTQTQSNQKKNSRFKKNIDSYAPEKDETELDDNCKNNNCYHSNTDSFINNVPPTNNYNNNPYYGQNGLTNPYAYNGYAYNNGYGYQNRYRRFNPYRNTDTFYPYNRNIDTYRSAPNLNYPVNANPIPNGKENEKENHVIQLNTKIDENQSKDNLDELVNKEQQMIDTSSNLEGFKRDVKENSESIKNITETIIEE